MSGNNASLGDICRAIEALGVIKHRAEHDVIRKLAFDKGLAGERLRELSVHELKRFTFHTDEDLKYHYGHLVDEKLELLDLAENPTQAIELKKNDAS